MTSPAASALRFLSPRRPGAALPFLLLLPFSGALESGAEPALFHFSGTVSRIERDDAGLAQAAGLMPGSPLNYVFQVDFDGPGQITRQDGSIENLEDLPAPGEMGNLFVHFFRAELVEGLFLTDPAGEATRLPNGQLASRYGSNLRAAGSQTGSLFHGGVLASLNLYLNSGDGFFPPLTEPFPWGYRPGDVSVENWSLGERILAMNAAPGADGQVTVVHAELTLDRIQAVPEPGSGLLLVVGATLVAGARRRHRPLAVTGDAPSQSDPWSGNTSAARPSGQSR